MARCPGQPIQTSSPINHEELELSGGTGRLAGATGTLHVVGTADLSTLEYEQILTGTLSRPDST